jgi:hypothetical protein
MFQMFINKVESIMCVIEIVHAHAQENEINGVDGVMELFM